MTSVTFALHRKTHSVRVEAGAYSHKLSFQLRIPKGHRLYTHDGKEVRSGYVEFVAEKPKHETGSIWFIDEMKDPDTGAIDPPSLSFYALITTEFYSLIRDSHPSLSFELRITTEFLGPLQFDDPLGTTIKWDTSRQNPVPVQSYELLFTSPASDA